MNASAILTSVAILGGVGLTFGTLIALAHRKLWVWADPRIDTVAGLLPGTNCGACGLAGCHAFAEAAVDGEVTPATCTVMAPPVPTVSTSRLAKVRSSSARVSER